MKLTRSYFSFQLNWWDFSLLFWLALLFSSFPLHFPFSLFTLTYSLLFPLEFKLLNCVHTSFGISVCGLRWGTPILEQERMLNCTSLTRSLENELTFKRQKSHLFRCRVKLEFLLNYKIRTKYAESVPSAIYSMTFLFSVLATISFHFYKNLLKQFHFPSLPQIHSISTKIF